jgi:pimeloyl-ACP methyl ester carboxylesterase
MIWYGHRIPTVLCPQLVTLSLDNRGIGQTTIENPGDITLEEMAHDVLELVQRLVEKHGFATWSLLGISMGGMIAQTAAFYASQLQLPSPKEQTEKGQIDNTTRFSLPPLSHLFLVSTTAGGDWRVFPPHTPPRSEIKFHKRTAPRSLEDVKNQMSRYFGSRFLANSPLLFELFCKNICKLEQEKVSSQEISRDTLSEEERQFYASLHFNGGAFLKKLEAQQIIVYTGDEDGVIPPQNSHYLQQQIPRSRLRVYPRVGHLILIEEPENFAQDVASALNGH